MIDRNKNETPLVFIVDDDEEVRAALQELLLSVGLDVQSFASPRELMDIEFHDRPGCLVLDVRMPGVSGLDLQNQLAAKGILKPIVFLTGHGDIPMSVQAMKAGAVDFLTKPVRDQTLLDAITVAIEKDMQQTAAFRRSRHYIALFSTLTTRERQVMREVARGRLNKQIAFDLGIKEITVKLHRGNLMKKMNATSVGELIRAWEALPGDIQGRIES